MKMCVRAFAWFGAIHQFNVVQFKICLNQTGARASGKAHQFRRHSRPVVVSGYRVPSTLFCVARNWQFFGTLVLFRIQADFCKQMWVLHRFSRPTVARIGRKKSASMFLLQKKEHLAEKEDAQISAPARAP